jgi:hypothetical protein
MELKLQREQEALITHDMGKCVVVTCLSALDFLHHVGVIKDIRIPFVIGDDETVHLYTCK